MQYLICTYLLCLHLHALLWWILTKEFLEAIFNQGKIMTDAIHNST